LPLARAFASPDLTRSPMRDRSNWPTAPINYTDSFFAIADTFTKPGFAAEGAGLKAFT
jgi:hypothetical protein